MANSVKENPLPLKILSVIPKGVKTECFLIRSNYTLMNT